MADQEIILQAVKMLEQGGIMLYPTDTLIGLGCDVLNVAAIDNIFAMKGRDFTKPMSVACADLQMIEDYTILSAEDKKALADLLPGPYTFVLPKNHKVSDLITAGSESVGVRIPDYPILLDIIERLGRPIITTSANKSGDPDIQALDESPYGVDFVLDTPYIYTGPSTVLDLKNKRILREGVGAELLKQYFNL